GLGYRGAEIDERVRVRLDEQDVAARADGGHHLDIERDLLSPAGVVRGIVGSAALVDLLEARTDGADGKAELRAIGGEFGRGVRVVIRVDDGDRLPGAAGSELVGALKLRGAQPRRARCRGRLTGPRVDDDVGGA